MSYIPPVSARAPILRAFIARLHRRLLAVRLLECAGVGLLGGSSLALVVVGALLWQGRNAGWTAIVLPALGALTGLVWACTHRPSSIFAAKAWKSAWASRTMTRPGR